MVQLSPCPVRGLSPSSSSEDGGKQPANHHPSDSQRSLSPLQSISSAATSFQAYEMYIDNGVISLKHKIRNIEKKKVKLDDYRDRLNNGELLNQDQLEAVEKYGEVLNNLEFARELQKTFSALSQDLLKVQKKAQRRDNLQKVEAEKKRLRAVLQVQYMLQSFSQDHVQKDFKQGLNGAMFVSSKELDYLVKFSTLTCPKRYPRVSLEEQMEQSSLHFWSLLEGSEKAVAGTTYKSLKDLLARLLDCGYFESVPEPPRETPKRETLHEELLKMHATIKPSKIEIKEPEPTLEYIRSGVHPSEFPIRNYSPKVEPVKQDVVEHASMESKYMKPQALKPWGMPADAKLQEQKRGQLPTSVIPSPKPWAAASLMPAKCEAGPKKCEAGPKKCEAEPKERRERVAKLPVEVKQLSHMDLKVPVSLATNCPSVVKKKKALLTVGGDGELPPVVCTAQSPKVTPQSAEEFCSTQTLPKDPDLRKEKLKDLMDEIKGTYNFMQESILDSDRSLPTVAPSQPPPESAPIVVFQAQSWGFGIISHVRTSDSHLFAQEEEETTYNTAQMYVTNTNVSELPLEKIEAPIPLPCEMPPSPKALTSSPMLQLPQEAAALSPPRSVPLSIISSPFQGMQAVFKVNAPLPPRKETEMKDDAPYCSPYHQTWSTASTQTAPPSPLDSDVGDQTSFLQEPLTGSPYPSDGTIHMSNGNMSYYTTPNLMPRMTQPFVSSRASLRATNRGGRVMSNGYRCVSGYKGCENYRGAQSVPNGGYGHAQCSGRDYPAAPYSPRVRSHICFNIVSFELLGWSEYSQVNSAERDDHFNSGEPGQVDSRSITPVDMSMATQAATILPFHVYPLPQQMRVAFSAARTSNLAPGSLDQPIVFDLLLNNLGETFDFQLGRFLCPVNGTYVFIFHMLKLAVNVPLYVNLMKNEEVLVSAYANDGAPDHETASNHAVLQLFHGDQIWLRLHRGAIYGSSWKYSTFSGYLLYQD
ncbi:hypothetical protein FKM82_011756 [Ascaphus truei]